LATPVTLAPLDDRVAWNVVEFSVTAARTAARLTECNVLGSRTRQNWLHSCVERVGSIYQQELQPANRTRCCRSIAVRGLWAHIIYERIFDTWLTPRVHYTPHRSVLSGVHHSYTVIHIDWSTYGTSIAAATSNRLYLRPPYLTGFMRSAITLTNDSIGWDRLKRRTRYNCEYRINFFCCSALFHHFNDVSICFCPTPDPLHVVQSTSLLLYLHLHRPSISSVVFLGFFSHWYSSVMLLLATVRFPFLIHARTNLVFALCYSVNQCRFLTRNTTHRLIAHLRMNDIFLASR